MILKIKANNPVATESWRFFENVEGLHYSKYQFSHLAFERNRTIPEDVQEIHMMEDRPCCENGDNNGHGETLECCFYAENLGAVHLYCNTQAYLLNDNGKTIERLI